MNRTNGGLAKSPIDAFGNNIRTVGGPDSGAEFTDINDAVASIDDSSATKPYTILHIGGTITVGPVSGDEPWLYGPSATKDYINLVGISRDGCIISRPASPGTGSPVIQAASHCSIETLTITSPVSRLIHWDAGAGSSLLVRDCNLPEGGGGNGISTGVTGAGSLLEVRDCLLGVNVGVHNGGGAVGDMATVIVAGNTMTPLGGTAIGIDLTTGTSSIMAYIHGNGGAYFNVDASHAIALTLTEGAAPRALVYLEAADLVLVNVNGVSKFWNRFIFPQAGTYRTTLAYAEADILAVTLSTMLPFGGVVDRVTVANSQWPAVAIEDRDPSGIATWWPRLATGQYAEVTCTTAAIAVGDIIVTSTTAGQAMANNAQTDLTRILGWAVMAKGAGATGRVVVKLNRAINAW